MCSVNEEEPPTTHSLIFNLTYHVSRREACVVRPGPLLTCPMPRAVGVRLSPAAEGAAAEGVSESGSLQA